MMENALTKADAQAMAPATWTTMKEQAAVMIKSGFLPPSIRTPEQAIAIAMAGRELGIGFMESLRSINVIQGKPTISPQLMLALANRTGEIENIKIKADNDVAVVAIKRRGRDQHVETFGVNEATALGLITKDNYKKQPSTMFKWRALAANLRVTFPDVLLGLYTPEELGANVTVAENEEMVVETKPTPEPVVEMAKKSFPDAEVVSESTKEWPHPADAADDPDLITFEFTPAAVSEKQYKPGKFRYGIKNEAGTWFTTFSRTHAENAKAAKRDNVPLFLKARKGEFNGKTQYTVEFLSFANPSPVSDLAEEVNVEG